MIKTGQHQDRVQNHPSDGALREKSGVHDASNMHRAAGFAPARLGLLLAASLSLVGCSLAMPEERELFAASPPGDRDAAQLDADAGQLDSGGGGQLDGSIDAGPNRDGGDAQQRLDTGVVSDASSDAIATDAAFDADGAQAQDAAMAVFQPEEGLVVHYRFNESSGNTVNDFAGDKDALIVGTPAGHQQWIAAGRVDGALKLAGVTPDAGTGHYVELPQGALLGLQQCSISLWVNRSGGPMWQRVFDLGSGPPVWLFFTPHGGTGLPIVAGRTPALIFVDFIPIPEAPAGEGVLKINQPIPVSTWMHFVLTWSSDELKVYLNGRLAAQAQPHGRVAPTDLGNTGQNYLGRSQFETDPYFNGMLDEFRIYNRVLTASDVAQLYELN